MNYLELENDLLRLELCIQKIEQPMAVLTVITDTILSDGIKTELFSAMAGELSALVGFDVTTSPVEATHEAFLEALASGARKVYKILYDIVMSIIEFIKRLITNTGDIKKNLDKIRSAIHDAKDLDMDKTRANMPSKDCIAVLDYLFDGTNVTKVSSGAIVTRESKYLKFNNDPMTGTFSVEIERQLIVNDFIATGSLSDAGYKSKQDVEQVFKELEQATDQAIRASKTCDQRAKQLASLTQEASKEPDQEKIRAAIARAIGEHNNPSHMLRYHINAVQSQQRLLTYALVLCKRASAFNIAQ